MSTLEKKWGSLLQNRQKQAASEVPLAEVPASKLALAKALPHVTPIEAWDGIHGLILVCEHKQMGAGFRIAAASMKKLLAHSDFRWVDGNSRTVSIGC